MWESIDSTINNMITSNISLTNIDEDGFGPQQKKKDLAMSSESNRMEEMTEKNASSQPGNVAQLLECFGQATQVFDIWM